MQARADATRQHVEIAHGILVQSHAKEAAGKLSREQAQLLAMETIAALRYDGSEYFWINDMHPRVVMHPIKPELNGKDVSETKDPNGVPLFKAFVAKVRESGKGFVAYQWPKPGKDNPVEKLSYVQGFEPWGWVVGSGIYVGDVREAAQRQVAWMAAIVAAALLLAGYLFISFYRVMDGGLNETRRHLRAMTEGDLTTSPSPWGRDEAAQLMMELRAMQESLRQMPQGFEAPEASVHEPAIDFDFDKAIEAHRQWKVRLRKAIADRAQLDADTICRDDRCPLGQWLHGAGGQRWGGQPGFIALLGKHAEFHDVAGSVARQINSGAMAEAEQLLGSGSRFAQVSTAVSTLLTRAKRGL